jgi:zinc transporter ZupT
LETQVIGMALALVAAGADVVGGYLTVHGRGLARRTLLYIMGLGAGFMLAAAVLGRMPEAVAQSPGTAVFIVIGYLIIFVFENLFATHAHEPQEDHVGGSHALVGELCCDESLITRPGSYAALAGLLVHTFFDGVAIAAGFQTRSSVGVIMFLAVFLHKIPEGLSMSTIMLAANRTRSFAFASAVAIAASTVLGAVATFVVGELDPSTTKDALALATGTLIYIAASDLIPTTNPARTKWVVPFVVLGTVFYYLTWQALRLFGLE